MKKTFVAGFLSVLLATSGVVVAQTNAHWPQWRGPFSNGMARGDAPPVSNDSTNIKWKADVPSRDFSTPAIWGDRIFLTTAIPTGKSTPAPAPNPAEQNQRRAGGGA